jgi:hypothetical protein
MVYFDLNRKNRRLMLFKHMRRTPVDCFGALPQRSDISQSAVAIACRGGSHVGKVP